MARLPVPGSDKGTWGDVLNQFLAVAHTDDGMPKDVGVIADKQPGSSDLTTIASLSPNNDDVLQRKGGAWVSRTPAQVKADLALAKADVGLNLVDNTADASKPVSAAQAAAIATKPTWLGSGLNAARPAAGAGAGLWLSTDINGGTQYYSNGSTWTQLSSGVLDSGGQELAYIEINSFPITGNAWSARNGITGAQTRAFVANTPQDITNFETTWIPTDTRPVEIRVVVSQITIPTDAIEVGCRLMVDNGGGYVLVGQQNLTASKVDTTVRFDFSTRLPNGSQTLSVGVAASAKVQLFATSNVTLTGYAGVGLFGNFYPYIQVIRR